MTAISDSPTHGRGELGWVVPPPPENIGDIYILYGYCHIPTPRYAVAYRDHAYGDDAGRWVWWLQADDGDCYPWSDVVSQDIWCDGIMLLRRNPLERELERLERLEAEVS